MTDIELADQAKFVDVGIDIIELADQAKFVEVGIDIYGGGFMKALLGAMQCADIHNLRKIHDTWPKEWAQYLEMGKKLKQG